MKELRKLNFSLKGLVLLLFILRKIKFDGVSTNEYLNTFLDVRTHGHIIYHLYILVFPSVTA